MRRIGLCFLGTVVVLLSGCADNLESDLNKQISCKLSNNQPSNPATTELKQAESELVQQQQKLNSIEAQYPKESFNPEKQYQIQKINIEIKRLSDKIKELKSSRGHQPSC